MNTHETITAVRTLIERAERLLFVTGAGISADSGLPTYRGVAGLYEGRVTDEGCPVEVALSAPMFERRPEVTWKYIWQVGEACVKAKPNDAHRFLAALEAGKADVWVVTQNVDGLHRAAGSRNLVEVHGHAFDLYCVSCSADFAARDIIDGYAEAYEAPPRCAHCGGLVRPDVVLFGEALSSRTIRAFRMLETKSFDAVVSIGTTGMFPYISQYVVAARRQGVPTVEINPAYTELSDLFDHRLEMGAVAAVQALGLV
jgi:NAD-dependent deacetylase